MPRESGAPASPATTEKVVRILPLRLLDRTSRDATKKPDGIPIGPPSDRGGLLKFRSIIPLSQAREHAASDFLLKGRCVISHNSFHQPPNHHHNPHFPALRSGPLALSGASRRKQIPSSDGSALPARMSQALRVHTPCELANYVNHRATKSPISPFSRHFLAV